MEASLIFLYAVFIFSIILLTIAGVINAAFVIPLQYKQAKVRNGLVRLRQLMLIRGALSLTVSILAIVSLTARFIIPDTNILRYIITSVILLFSMGILGKSVIDFMIYHQQFDEKNKQLHERLDQIENGQKIASMVDKKKVK